MPKKSYLSGQIGLVALSVTDFYTEEEVLWYEKLKDVINRIGDAEKEDAKSERVKELVQEKKQIIQGLENEISKFEGQRVARLKSILYWQDKEEPLPEGATWDTLKDTKQICEFCSDLSRAMGLNPNEITTDLIVVDWHKKSVELVRQITVNGIIIPWLDENGNIERREYEMFTASAGQLRHDKFQMISKSMHEKVRPRLECGLTWEIINAKGGINPAKLMAYSALVSSATDEWTDFDIDRCIVIDEFESEVTDRMMFINPDYSYEFGVHTVKIDHTDGCGIMSPEVSKRNFMFRMPWFKGLLISGDYIKFCKYHNVKPVIKDIYGLEHDLEKEHIQIIFTKSMFKMYKYYTSWQDYKDKFKANNCRASRTNYEEAYLPDKNMNYQFIQTLEDFTDDEIKEYTREIYEKIEGLTKDKEAMLETMRADPESPKPYNAALALYPELLHEAYTRNSLKDIRKKMILDAKSGKFKTDDKRLYAAPDIYAAFEFWFLGIKNPEGLLKKGEIACVPYRRHTKADVLRSPHLSMEHSIQNIVQDQDIYEWLYTNAVYTSCHDMISRILQLDVDGDQLNVVVNSLFVSVAERNVQKYDVVPLFYDADAATPEEITKESIFKAIKRAHDCSGIGEISNMLTRLWNRPHPDRIVAALLCRYNNSVIDGAKTGFIRKYDDFPEVAKRISKAIGGKTSRMPHWFQFSPNGRKSNSTGKKKNYAKPNDSTMNRLCAVFNKIGNINLNYAGVAPFNWRMLLSEPCRGVWPEAVELFCKMDESNLSSVIKSYNESEYEDIRSKLSGYNILANKIREELTAQFGSLENVFPYITKALFAAEGVNQAAHKQMYWRVFGNIALKNIKQNIKECDECPQCKMRVPSWVGKHQCLKNARDFFECIDCGKVFPRKNSKQYRCDEDQLQYRRMAARINMANYRSRKKDKKEEVNAKRIISLRSH